VNLSVTNAIAQRKRVQRTLLISYDLEPLWTLLRLLDGDRSAAELRGELGDCAKPIKALAAAGSGWYHR
jgi:hypothetical protein